MILIAKRTGQSTVSKNSSGANEKSSAANKNSSVSNGNFSAETQDLNVAETEDECPKVKIERAHKKPVNKLGFSNIYSYNNNTL